MEKILCPKNLFVGIFCQNYFFCHKKDFVRNFFPKIFFYKKIWGQNLVKKKEFLS